MSRTFLRRLVSTSAAVLIVGVVGVGSAFASSTTLPANNPTDYQGLQKNANAQVFVTKIASEKFNYQAFSYAVSTKPGGRNFAAKISVSKGFQHNYSMTQTITITPNCDTTTKCMVASAYATLSGGNFGSGVITGTKVTKNGKSYVITMLFDEQGTNPNLNIKFYLYRP